MLSVATVTHPEIRQDVAALHVLRPEPDLPVGVRLILQHVHQGSTGL